MFSVRSAVLATAFAVTMAAAVSGISFRGETKEVRLDEACAHETWPSIPVQCLTGNLKPSVRVVSAESDYQRDMQARFAVAFE